MLLLKALCCNQLCISMYKTPKCNLGFPLTSIGVPLCEVEEGGTKYLNFSAFTVTEQTRNNINKKFKQFSNLGRNCQRPILADFNSDSIDDVYCPSAYGHMFNDKFYLAVLMLYLYQIKMENGFKLKKQVIW